MDKRSLFCIAASLVAGTLVGLRLGTAAGRAPALPHPCGVAAANTLTRSHMSNPMPTRIQSAPGRQGGALFAEVRSLLDRIPLPPPPPTDGGDGRITGQVMDHTGQPVAGVQIVAISEQGLWKVATQFASRDDTERRLEHNILRVLAGERYKREHAKETATEATGRYALEGLGHTTYALMASLAGYRINPAQQQRRVVPDAELDFVALKQIEVVCNVQLPDGSEPEQAHLTITRAGSGGGSSTSTQTWTPLDRAMYLDPGEVTLRATAGEDKDLASAKQELSITTDLDAALTFQLAPRTGIRGKVTAPDGTAGLSLRVLALRWNAPTQPSYAQLAQGLDTWLGGHQDRYSFLDIAPGSYIVAVCDFTAQHILASGRAEVVDSVVELNLSIPLPDPSGRVTVWVYGPANELLRDVNISAGFSAAQGFFGRSGLSGKNEDGSYWVTPTRLPDTGLHEGTHTIRVASRTLGMRSVAYDPTAATPVVVRFEGVGTLRIVTAGSSGPRLSELSMSLRDGKTQDTTGFGVFDSPLKAMVFRGIAAGGYDLVVSRNSYRGHAVIGVFPVTVKPGETEIAIQLPTLYSLAVNAPDRDFGNTVRLRRTNPDATGIYVMKLGPDRKGVFQDLPTGAYTVSMEDGKKSARYEIQVPEDAGVNFVASDRNAIWVAVDDPGGYLGSAGFRTDDLIYAINNMQFKDIPRVDKLFAGLEAMETVSVWVVRNGEAVKLTVDAKKMRGSGSGGRLIPVEIQWE